MAMYDQPRTAIRMVYGNSEVFKVGVGMHQSSGLDPLLFAIDARRFLGNMGWFTLGIALCR